MLPLLQQIRDVRFLGLSRLAWHVLKLKYALTV